MLKQATPSYLPPAHLSRRATITSARVDPEAPPAIFRPASPHRASTQRPKAPVAELVDALDSKSSSARSAGSIPARGTIPHPPHRLTFIFLDSDSHPHFHLTAVRPVHGRSQGAW